MIRPQRIPLVSLVLSMACNNRPEGAVTDTTTDATTVADTGGLGASETGLVTTGGADASGVASSTGAATTTAESTGSFMAGSTGTGTSTGSDTDSSTDSSTSSSTNSSTGWSCEDREPPDVPPPNHECHPEPCAMGEICLRTLQCQTVDLPCYGECIVEQHPTYCVPISDHCDPDADDLEYCLENEYDSFCSYGGTYTDGVLTCHYAFDQCREGLPFPIPGC